MSDAGIEAINQAISKAMTLGIDLKTAIFIQVPHHGSKHNVGPSTLDSILGLKSPELKEEYMKTAFASVPKEGDPKHPSKKVANAFKRRGAKVIVTKGNTIHHFSSDAPDCPGWIKAEPLPFYDQVAE